MSVSSLLKKSYEATRRSQQIVKQAVAADGNGLIDHIEAMPEAVSEDYLGVKDLYTFPKESSEGQVLDFDRARKQLPQYRKCWDVIQKWQKAHDDAIANLPVGITPKTCAVMRNYMEDYEAEVDQLEAHINYMQATMSAKLEDFENKQSSLLDIKIKDLVEENPQWAEEIRAELAEFRITHPEEDVPWNKD